MKSAMMTIPMLTMPDITKEFRVKTDASRAEVGAMLMQGGRPIAFMSKALLLRNQGKSVYKKELMAIVLAF